MSRICKFPIAVSLSEKFLWEVMLTDKWDHIFLGDENMGLPVFPRQISFCPTERTWFASGDDGRIVYYREPTRNSIVTVGMERKSGCSGYFWSPHHICFHIEVPDMELHEIIGTRLVTPGFKVWTK